MAGSGFQWKGNGDCPMRQQPTAMFVAPLTSNRIPMTAPDWPRQSKWAHRCQPAVERANQQRNAVGVQPDCGLCAVKVQSVCGYCAVPMQSDCGRFAVCLRSLCRLPAVFHGRSLSDQSKDSFRVTGVCSSSGQCYCPSSMPEHGSATRDLGTPRPVCVVVVLLACPTRHWRRWRLQLEKLTIA